MNYFKAMNSLAFARSKIAGLESRSFWFGILFDVIKVQ